MKTAPLAYEFATPSLGHRVRSTVTDPLVTGILTASIWAFFPNVYFKVTLTELENTLLAGYRDTLGEGSQQLLSAATGFLVGFSSMKLLRWARKRLIMSLLTYQGWLFSPRAFSTKVWAMTLHLILGGKPYYEKDFKGLLPKLPVPKLTDTRDRYLSLAKVVVSDEELARSKELWKDFMETDGPILQAELENRATVEENWLFDWWDKYAYLANRGPLAIRSNYFIAGALQKSVTTNQLAQTANGIFGLLTFHNLLKTEQLRCPMMQDLIPTCTALNKRIISTTRIPGEDIDHLQSYPDSTHIIICRKGYYFKVDLYIRDGQGKSSPLTLQEVREVVGDIYKKTEGMPGDTSDVAVLTAQNRPIWAKNRKILQEDEKNAVSLQAVESAIFIVSLDDEPVQNPNELYSKVMIGNGTNRWFDKSFTLATFPGSGFGMNVEHSVGDGQDILRMYSMFLFMAKYDSSGEIPPSVQPLRDLPAPSLLEWNMDNLQDEIKNAKEQYNVQTAEYESSSYHSEFAKRLIKPKKLSPDGFYQMAFQLAYYRLHGKVVKTYESGITKTFHLGRTETIYPISEYSKAFVESMDDPSIPKDEKMNFLRKAIKAQTEFKVNTVAGQGIDRHLLGLVITAKESGKPLHPLFSDKFWQTPHTLSTSQGPTQFVESGIPVDLNYFAGGFGVADESCYGIGYSTIGEDTVNVNVSTWKSNKDLCAERMTDAIRAAMTDMREAFLQ